MYLHTYTYYIHIRIRVTPCDLIPANMTCPSRPTMVFVPRPPPAFAVPKYYGTRHLFLSFPTSSPSPSLRLAQDPCTQGVDISRAVVPLKEFATLDGCTATREVSASSQGWLVGWLPLCRIMYVCMLYSDITGCPGSIFIARLSDINGWSFCNFNFSKRCLRFGLCFRKIPGKFSRR